MPAPHLPAVMALLAVAASAFAATAKHTPTSGSGSVVVESRATPGHRPLRRLVYTCVAPDLVVFADRPCGPWPAQREVRLFEPVRDAPGAAATVRAPTPDASTRPAAVDPDVEAVPDERELQAARCERLGAAVRTLDDRMRTGYTAREAGRLWQRWREAKSRLREADC